MTTKRNERLVDAFAERLAKFLQDELGDNCGTFNEDAGLADHLELEREVRGLGAALAEEGVVDRIARHPKVQDVLNEIVLHAVQSVTYMNDEEEEDNE